MRPKLAILALVILLAAIIVPLPMAIGEEPSSFDLYGSSAPLVTWSKDLDSGYVSSAPLLWGGIAVVKTPGGLVAYLQSDGSELWNVSMESELQFEMSPLLPFSVTQINGIYSIPDVVITGWSSGEVTAHRLVDGRLHWSVNTSAPAYGIQGAIVKVASNSTYHEILVPMETGVLSLDPATGEENWNVTFPNGARGYRHWPTYWLEGNLIWYAVGDEQGRMTYWNSSAPNAATTFDFTIQSGEIRSQILALGGGELLIPIQSSAGSVLIHWADGTILQQYSFQGSFGIMAHSQENIIIPTTHTTTWWKYDGELEFIAELTDQPVVGKAQALGSDLFALPINTEQGEIMVYRINPTNSSAELQWTWSPQVSGYMMAGMGFDFSYNAIAISNDAGRVEISINDAQKADGEYHYRAQRLAEWQSQDSTSSLGPTYEESGEVGHSAQNSGYMLIGFGLVLGLFCFLLKKLGRRPQIAFAGAATLILIGMILLLPIAQQSVNKLVVKDGEERDDSLWPESWKGTQVIGFEFSDPFLIEIYANSITLINSDGSIISSRPAGNQTPSVWVGGISGATTGYELTILGCEAAGLQFVYHQESIGGYVDTIALAEDGKDDRWLLYWVDGIHANVAINAYGVEEDAILIWYYL